MRFSGPHTIPLRALINKDIVNIIIGDMMFYPEDMVGINRARLLSIFLPTLDSSDDAADAGNVSRYAIIIGNTKHFQLVAQYLAAGLLFCPTKKSYLASGALDHSLRGLSAVMLISSVQ